MNLNENFACRFDFQRLFGGKISKDIHFEEKFDLSPFLSHKPVSHSEMLKVYASYLC